MAPKVHEHCKHIRSAVIGLAHALCRGTWQARRCVVIVLVLRNSGCTTVYNKSKLTVTEAHTITLQACALYGNVVIAIGITSKQVPKILVRSYCKNFLIKIMSQCTHLYKY